MPETRWKEGNFPEVQKVGLQGIKPAELKLNLLLEVSDSNLSVVHVSVNPYLMLFFSEKRKALDRRKEAEEERL